ncbi:fatty acyl-CoA reductase wat-like, partial [Melitaea cinxia]|uniref:fatty acyl-CoA reductase wat-like n=1 Tax=Melitaea cinxia TaxID=113334 RepID=UPI001E272536
INEANLSGDSEVQKFYDGSVVFITGGSGFVGKHLIEKLIRTTNVKKIYVLLRAKKGKNIQERLEQILQDPLYSELRKDNPTFVDRIMPILGDVSEINLGLDEKSWAILTDEVNVILHSAATVNFVEKVKLATITNVRGVREMLKLAKACKNIKSVVHISTAYSNATKSRIKQEINEDFYDSPIPPDVLIELSETLDTDTVEDMCKIFMNEWPNSYTLTKAVAEDLVRREKDLPICIVRPSIVIAAYNEPTPGWIERKNVFGPSGVLVGLSLGVIHVILADTAIFIDIVPVDYVNNTVLVAAWKNYLRYQLNEKEKKIYTVTSTRKPFKWGSFREILINEGRQLMSSKAIWYGFALEIKYKTLYSVFVLLLHFIPACIVDGCCLLLGIKPRLFKAYQMIEKLFTIFGYFTMKEWFFEDKKTMNLYNELSKTDKILFNFDVTNIETRENIRSWLYGIKKYVIKDDMTDVEYSMKKQFWFRIANYIFVPAYSFFLFKLVSYAFIFIHNVLSFLFSNSDIIKAK